MDGDGDSGILRVFENVHLDDASPFWHENSNGLISEGQCAEGQGIESFIVIQRCCWSRVMVAIDSEGDVLKEEGLGSGVWISRFSVLGRSEEPVESCDGKVEGVAVEDAVGRMVEV